MTDLATVHHWPEAERPLLVIALEGWIDAGGAAASAVAALHSSMPNELVADFDADALIDHRARRPVVRITNGTSTELRWPAIELRAAINRTGRTVLTLSGPEPDMRWHQFTAEVVALASRLGVELVIGLGAFPAPVPHTRPVRLTATGTDLALTHRVGFIPATVEVPAGVQASLEQSFGQASVPAVGLWARVPHYVAAMPYPAAAAALLDKLAELGELEVETEALRTAAATTATQIDQLVGGNEEHVALLHQLEAQHDQEQGLSATEFGELPSGDELAAEMERFLRGER